MSVKNIILVVVSILLLGDISASMSLAEEAGSQESCGLQREALISVLEEKELKGYKMTLSQDEIALIERGLLPDGTSVEYKVGGCEHYAYSFTFTNIHPDRYVLPVNPVDMAIKLMNDLPLKTSENMILLQSLKELQQSGLQIFSEQANVEFLCLEAQCSLNNSKGTLSVSYNFPL